MVAAAPLQRWQSLFLGTVLVPSEAVKEFLNVLSEGKTKEMVQISEEAKLGEA